MESKISGHTKLYCLIGSPVGHSGSPAMYNYSFERTGIDAAYLAFNIPLEETEKAVQALKTLGVGGFNVTMPDKTAVASYLDALSPAAKLIGACNTVTVGEDGRLTGHNTDGMGFVRNLREHGIEVKGKRLVVLGAGGAATAICVQAALDGAAEIAIFNRGQGDFFPNGQRTVEKLRQAVPACRASIYPPGGQGRPGPGRGGLRHPGERHPGRHEAPGRRDPHRSRPVPPRARGGGHRL